VSELVSAPLPANLHTGAHVPPPGTALVENKGEEQWVKTQGMHWAPSFLRLPGSPWPPALPSALGVTSG
jgi:hypothetical protein